MSLTPRVLLIDDSILDRELAREFLGPNLVEADMAEPGDRMVRDGGFDVVLLDQHLPDGYGSELLAAWREDGIQTIVIGLMSSGLQETEEAFFQAGANAVLNKEDYLTGAIGRTIEQLFQAGHPTANTGKPTASGEKPTANSAKPIANKQSKA